MPLKTPLVELEPRRPSPMTSPPPQRISHYRARPQDMGFFTLIQPYLIYSCRRRQLTKHEKVMIRIVRRRSVTENVAYIRRMLHLKNGDELTFEDERGIIVNVDYDDLRSYTLGSGLTRIALYIRPQRGHFMGRLARDGRKSRFDLFEDEAVQPWGVGRREEFIEGFYNHDKCICLRDDQHFRQFVEREAWRRHGRAPEPDGRIRQDRNDEDGLQQRREFPHGDGPDTLAGPSDIVVQPELAIHTKSMIDSPLATATIALTTVPLLRALFCTAEFFMCLVPLATQLNAATRTVARYTIFGTGSIWHCHRMKNIRMRRRSCATCDNDWR